jgi:hypothetical protein
MILDKIELENTILKLNQQETLWQADKGVVKANEGTLIVPIRKGDTRIGYILLGDCTLILDTIVETLQGAVGKPIEEQLKDPFLMLAQDSSLRSTNADTEDIVKMGYKDTQDFKDKIGTLANHVLGDRHIGCHYHSPNSQSRIFIFTKDDHKFGILVATSSHVVYKTKGLTFIANENHIILKSPETTTIASSRGHPTICTSVC